ncbi:hypothetical protein QR685DRAFT_51193 [Neurospora intermedia]|uniref:Uncharacterized protein n=1 Tax=Neurospora intermedia TaxID=5142 RepID=A0ABR3DS48_NEUIN
MLVARVTPNSLRESGAHAVMFSYEIPVTCPIVHLIFVCVCVCVFQKHVLLPRYIAQKRAAGSSLLISLSKPDETELARLLLIETKPDHLASSSVWQDHHISSQPNFGFPVAKFPIRLSSAYQMYSSFFRSALPKDDGPSFNMCSKCVRSISG